MTQLSATVLTESLPAQPRAIDDKLRRLRRRIVIWFAVDGLSRVLACLVALMVLDLAIDWGFSMDRPQRVVMLLLSTAALAAVFYRRLVRPLAYRFSDDALCLLVERQHRELGQSLISAVQFARGEGWEHQGLSPALVAATIHLGTQAATPLAFHSVLRRRPFVLNLLLGIALALALCAAAVAAARIETMSIWFDRNVLLRNRPWPQDFYLSIDGATDGVLRVVRGEDWPLGIGVRLARDKVPPPDEMLLELRDNSQTRSQALERTGGGRHFSGKLSAMLEPIEIRASGRHVSTPWIKVEPVDRPAVVKLAISARLPKYAGGEEQVLPPGRGPYAILPGSRLTFRGSANKPLTSAMLVRGAERRPLELRGTTDFELAIPYGEKSAGVYAIELVDTERMPQPESDRPGPLRSRAPTQFTLATRPDRPPQIKARLSGVSGMVVPQARVPISARIEDDFAVRDVRLHVEWHGPAGSEQNYDGVVRPAGLTEQPGRAVVDLAHVLDIQSLKIPVGSDLTLTVEADDNNEVAGPQTGKSVPILLRVVSEDELRTDLLRREREQRLELERIAKAQVGVIADSRELLRRAGGGPSLSADNDELLGHVARDQKMQGASIASVARRIGELLTEAEYNRLDEESGTLQARLRDRVQKPLSRLSDQSVAEVILRLDEVRRLSIRAVERDQALTTAIGLEGQIEAGLNDVLKNMIKVEDFQVVLGLLLEIQRSQSEVLTRAEKERQELIKKILEQGGAGVGRSDGAAGSGGRGVP